MLFISTEADALINLDYIDAIEPSEVNSEGKQRLEAKSASSAVYNLFTGTPAEVEEFHEELKEYIRKR